MLPERSRDRELTAAAEAAFERVFTRVVERAKHTGTPVVIWQGDAVQEIPSELLLVNKWENDLAQEHRKWLAGYDPQYAANWERLLKADPESALTEAAVRRLLEAHGAAVEPAESLSGERRLPDFRCTIDDQDFYVEATCIPVANATTSARIGIDTVGAAGFNPMWIADAAWSKCKDKAAQCANLDFPVLIAIGTFHGWAAMVGFDKVLIGFAASGKTTYCWSPDSESGQQADDTHSTTRFEHASFIRLDKSGQPRFARSSISGLLFCPMTLPDQKPVGLLHPSPARPFDPLLLPEIDFATVELNASSRQLLVRWPTARDD